MSVLLPLFSQTIAWSHPDPESPGAKKQDRKDFGLESWSAGDHRPVTWASMCERKISFYFFVSPTSPPFFKSFFLIYTAQRNPSTKYVGRGWELGLLFPTPRLAPAMLLCPSACDCLLRERAAAWLTACGRGGSRAQQRLSEGLQGASSPHGRSPAGQQWLRGSCSNLLALGRRPHRDPSQAEVRVYWSKSG